MPRAKEVVKLLEKLTPSSCAPEPLCTLCQTWADYGEHLGGPKHWSKLHPLLPDGVPIEKLKQQHWNYWQICHGWLGFNELTGELQVSKGDAQPGAPLPAPEAALPIGKGGCPGPQNFGGEEQDPASEWDVIAPPLSLSSNPHADWKSFAHLRSKKTFSEHMKPRGHKMEEILSPFGAHPYCRACGGPGSHHRFSEHIAGPAHFVKLMNQYIKDGARVADVREELWNTYELPQDVVIRFNELDGTIEKLKKLEAKANQRPQAEPRASAYANPQPPWTCPAEPRAPAAHTNPQQLWTQQTATFRHPPASLKMEPPAGWGLPSAAEDLQSEYGTVSVAAHPGTWAAMGQAKPDRSGAVVQKVAWAMWWCQQMATEEKVAEVHRILSVERAMKEVCCQGCGERVTYGTLAQHLRSQEHFAGLMLRALDDSPNSQDVRLKPVSQLLQINRGEATLDHIGVCISEDV